MLKWTSPQLDLHTLYELLGSKLVWESCLISCHNSHVFAMWSLTDIKNKTHTHTTYFIRSLPYILVAPPLCLPMHFVIILYKTYVISSTIVFFLGFLFFQSHGKTHFFFILTNQRFMPTPGILQAHNVYWMKITAKITSLCYAFLSSTIDEE